MECCRAFIVEHHFYVSPCGAFHHLVPIGSLSAENALHILHGDASIVILRVHDKGQSVVGNGEAFRQLAFCFQIRHLAGFECPRCEEETRFQLFNLVEALNLVGVDGFEVCLGILELELFAQFLHDGRETLVGIESDFTRRARISATTPVPLLTRSEGQG